MEWKRMEGGMYVEILGLVSHRKMVHVHGKNRIMGEQGQRRFQH